MQISIRNMPDRLDRSTLYRAVEFFGQRLMGKRLSKNVSVRIVFVKGLGCDANCTWEDDNHRPREFSVLVNSRFAMPKTLAALAHEMVHVKQYARGELKDYFNMPTTCRFNGKVYDTKKLDYFDYPWEKEAFSLENRLVIEFEQQES